MNISKDTKYGIGDEVLAIVEFTTPGVKVIRGKIVDVHISAKGAVAYDVFKNGISHTRIFEERIFTNGDGLFEFMESSK